MFLRREHPLLARCRMFLQPTGGTFVNLLGRSPAPTVTGTPAASHLGDRSPALRLDGSSYLQAGPYTSFGAAGKNITVVVRVRPTVLPGGGSAGGVVTCRTFNVPSATAGFVIGYSNNGGAGEPGWVWAVHGSDGGSGFLRAADQSASSTTLGKDIVVVATYSSSLRTATLYVDGRLVAVNQNTGTDWNPTDTADVYVGSLNGGALPFQGDIGAVLIYDRCLSAGEAQALSHAPWPFFVDEEVAQVGSGIVVTYTTGVGVDPAYAPSGQVTYATAVDALAFVGGDLTAVPNPASVTYSTPVAVAQVYTGGIPDLAFYSNTVTVGDTLTNATPVTYATVVLVGQRYRGLVDGRVNLIGNARYRR